MTEDQTDRIRERAHAIWLEQGCPEGQSEAHWAQAHAEILREEAAQTEAPAPKKAPVKRAPKAPAKAAGIDAETAAPKRRRAAPKKTDPA